MSSTVRARQTTEVATTSRHEHAGTSSACTSVSVREEAGYVLLPYEKLPAWYQDNQYILHGYRPSTSSVTSCLQSWTYLHNETANIYTHLLPALCFAVLEVLAYQKFKTLYPDATVTDRLVLTFFLLAAMGCMGLSTVYHTLMNHSAEVSHFWLRMDYLGIVGLILGDIVSGTYVIFYCQPSLRTFYWGMTLALSTTTCVVLLSPKFQGRQWRLFRVWAFICTGLSALLPLAHAISLFGTTSMLKHSGLSYYLLEGLLLFLGVFFYATRIPESLRPGKFDIWCSSHQIFHVLVVLATFVQFLGVWSVFDYKYTNRVCQIPHNGSGVHW